MLPERLLDLDLTPGTVQLRPRFLTTRSHLWVDALLDQVLANVGCPRDHVERCLARRPHLGERPAAWRAAAYLVQRLCGFEVRACAPPRLLRRALFLRAGAPTAGDPGRALDRAAAELGVAPAALEQDLYADIPAERVFKPLPRDLSVDDFIERYNLALAQGLLLRAEAVELQMQGNARAVLRFARLQRLLCLAETTSRGEVRIHLSGPMSLFHHTLKYGRALANWLPVVQRAPAWRLIATCQLRGQRRTWQASPRDPLGTTHGPVRRFDSQLEERFFRDLMRAAPQWLVHREPDPVQLGCQLCCPDFVLEHNGTGLRVPVELVGYWTAEYLRSKWDVLRRLPADRPWVVCVDQALAARADPVPDGIPCFWFHRRVDVGQFIAFLQPLVAAASGGK